MASTARRRKRAPAATLIPPTDGELLRLFARHAGEAVGDEAFQKLIERHGAMVWRVCRQVLPNQQDAEDAFQATLLILARRARLVKASESAAGWLYRVAFRTAVSAKRRLRRKKEARLEHEPLAPPETAFPDLAGRETAAVMMEELGQMPAKYRTPLVLRYLEGRTRREIADQTDSTIAAVQGRLARGKALLRSRLLRRGVSLSAAMGVVGAAATQAEAAPTRLVEQTSSNATAVATGGSLAASAAVVSLYREGVRAMVMAQVSKPLAAVAVMCLLTVGITHGQPANDQVAVTPDSGAKSIVVLDSEPPAENLLAAADQAIEVDANAEAGKESADFLTVDDWHYEAGRGPMDPLTQRSISFDDYTQRIKKFYGRQFDADARSARDLELAEVELRLKYWKVKASRLENEKRVLQFEYDQALKIDDKSRMAEVDRQLPPLFEEALLANANLLNYERRLRSMVNEPIRQSSAQQTAPSKTDNVHRFAPGEVIRLDADSDHHLSGANQRREYRIEQSGAIAMGALVGRVKIAGLTIAEAEAAIQKKLSISYPKEKIVVQVTDETPKSTAAAHRREPHNGSVTELWPNGKVKAERDYVDGVLVAATEVSESGQILYEMTDDGPERERSRRKSSSTQPEAKPRNRRQESSEPESVRERLLTHRRRLQQAAEQIRKSVPKGSVLAPNTQKLEEALVAIDIRLMEIANDEVDVARLFEETKQLIQESRASLSPNDPATPANAAVEKTSPASGATDVDPALSEVRVTFDRDMSTDGWSFTGGPDRHFPPADVSRQVTWVDKRTCVLPVRLAPKSFYRVGINSTSYQNFRDANGQPAQHAVITFMTRGATAGAQGAPRVVALSPQLDAEGVDPSLKSISVTFDRPMAGGMSWTRNRAEGAFPGSKNGRATWSDDRLTCTLPVELGPETDYYLRLNTPMHINFQSEWGVPLEPVEWRFRTRAEETPTPDAGASRVRMPIRFVALQQNRADTAAIEKEYAEAKRELEEAKRRFEAAKRRYDEAVGGGESAPASNTRWAVIAKSVPEIGATDVDPNLSEIRVTFDRDMSTDGWSWTGSPEFHMPPIDESRKPRWVDKRTCVLPVRLKSQQFYRVGINATDAQNFKDAGGAPAAHGVIVFATRGARRSVARRVRTPQIVEQSPANGATGVDPGLKAIKVTFDMPMGGGMSWTGAPGEDPGSGRPRWSKDGRTCMLPVELKPGAQYGVGLNASHAVNFQSRWGAPLAPVSWRFATAEESL